ncbi:hypothetical protein [Kaistella solincola]|uniref:hypothetical protein n=1 Tax=Kaistella solincola TaxID=510955 RepID=UPI000AE0DA02|nr:hypothetical protein [Kaistella solincola]
MFQIFLGALLIVFGIFLKVTKDPGFARTKKFYWVFLVIGAFSAIAKIILMYQLKEI